MTTQQTIDVRTIPPRDRHPRIFAALAALAPGEALAIVNDHDPKPLRYQLEAEQPGAFAWSYVEQGPERWQVTIARTSAVEQPAAPVPVATAPASARRAGPQLDNRGLEPPEPMVRILGALETLGPGVELAALLDREPLLLFPQLAARGFDHALEAQTDGTYLLRVWRAG
jgi:uncharacterized protein (DUF2249 family)